MAESQKERRKRLFLNAVKSLQLENPNAEIADKIGYDRGNLSRILNGNIAPSTTVVQGFEDAFKISIEDFDTEEKEKTPPEEVRLETMIAKEVMEELKPHLEGFQMGHHATGKQLHDIKELVKTLVALLIKVKFQVDKNQEDIKEIKEYSKEMHEVVSPAK